MGMTVGQIGIPFLYLMLPEETNVTRHPRHLEIGEEPVVSDLHRADEERTAHVRHHDHRIHDPETQLIPNVPMPGDEAGSFAYRWEQVLKRLDRTDPRELEELIRANLAATVGC